MSLLWSKLARLKQKNRFQYFLVLFVVWSMAAVIGVKIRGFYLTYVLFWIVFFVPAILHYDIPRKLLSRALPVLQQLDQSMKYERRSILDKENLLVDVKMPENDLINEEQENAYLKEFQLDNLDKMNAKERRRFDNLEDDDEDEEEYENEEEEEEDAEEEEDEEEIESFDDSQSDSNQVRNRIRGKNEPASDDDDEAEESEEADYNDRFKRATIKRNKGKEIKRALLKRDDLDADADADEDADGSSSSMLLPSETLMPGVNDISDDYTLKKSRQSGGGDRVVRKKIKNRPSLLDYYANTNSHNLVGGGGGGGGTDSSSSSAASNRKTSGNNQQPLINKTASINQRTRNEQDIDETFDFLDEELNKYTNDDNDDSR